MLAALEGDDAFLEEENILRTPWYPRMIATFNMVTAAIRHRHDVGGSNLGTTLDCAKCADQTTGLVVDLHCAGLRVDVVRLLRDTHASISDQPEGVGKERHNDHRGGDDGVPQYPPPRWGPRLPRRPNIVDASGGVIDDVS
jgi:hypothetical protein